MNLESFLDQYGYIALFIGTILEGGTVLVLAGFLAHQQYFQIERVILVAFVGTLLGDQLFFLIGRRYGQPFIQRRPHWKSKANRVESWLDRHENWLIVEFRFIYGMRSVTPFILGASDVSWRKYFFLNTVGALVWATVIGMVGFSFGQVARSVLGRIKQHELTIIVSICATGATIWLVYEWLQRRKQKTKP